MCKSKIERCLLILVAILGGSLPKIGFAQPLTKVGSITLWEAYLNVSVCPPNLSTYDWLTVADPTDWGDPLAANQTEEQESFFNGRYEIPLPSGTSQTAGSGTSDHYISAATPQSPSYPYPPASYFRLVFDLETHTSCGEYFLTYNADDEATIWVNGNQVSSTSNWTEDGFVNISSSLKCGQNIIAVEVRQTQGHSHWFIGELTSSGLEPTNGGLSYTRTDCGNPNPSLNLLAPNAKSYFWTGPDGFTSSSQNPIITNPSHPANTGVYYCQYIIGCCTMTSKINVVITNGCCDGRIIVNTDCQDYNFRVEGVSLDNSCGYWVVDGVDYLAGADNSIWPDLTDGEHDICVYYMGINKEEDNEQCCGEYCLEDYEVSRSSPENVATELFVCIGNSHVGFEPCVGQFGNGASNYMLKSIPDAPNSPYNYDSRVGYLDESTGLWVSGCIWHALIPGNYEIRYYDSAGCLIKVLNILVTEVEC